MNVSLGPYCKFRNPSPTYRRRRHRSPGTPFLDWKFDDIQRASGGGGVKLSARKLAAGLWQLRLLSQVSGGDGVTKHGSCDRLRFQPPAGHVNITLPFHCSSREHRAESKDRSQRTLLSCRPKPKVQHKHESLQCLKLAMEGSTKWDPSCSKASTEAYCFHNHMTKILGGQSATFSVASAQQAELLQVKLRIHELEGELRSSKKKFEHLMRKLGEAKKSWQSKHNKMRAVIDDLKEELNVGRQSQKRVEVINSKLVKELVDSKSSAKQLMQDYEEEKRARELMEEVCNELAKKIGEDKAEMEALRSGTFKIREELEEERRMLQLAEVWREERVQMKLVDAKLALEDKYYQLNKLIADLESFLRSRNATLDKGELRKAKLILQAVKSVNAQDYNEFEYVPPESGGIFSILEGLRQSEANGMEMDPLINYSSLAYASDYHTVSPEVNDFNNNHALGHSNGFVICNNGLEDVRNLEPAASQAEDLGSRHSLEGSDHSAIVNQGHIASRSRIECTENASRDSPSTEISEICSISGNQPKQKAFSVSKPRKPLPSNGKHCKITSDEVNERLSNGTSSSVGTASPHRKSVKGGLRQHNSVGQLVSPGSVNPHITRGMKGPVEWPRGIQKNSLKAKCLKAMIGSQKIRNALRKARC